MRKIIGIFFILVIAGCSMVEVDCPRFSSFDDIRSYMDTHYKYIGESIDKWKTPAITIRDGGGDCEDLAILFLYYSYKSFNIKGDLIIAKCPSGAYHAMALINGYTYYEIDGQKEINRMSYDAAMAHAEMNCMGDK